MVEISVSVTSIPAEFNFQDYFRSKLYDFFMHLFGTKFQNSESINVNLILKELPRSFKR